MQTYMRGRDLIGDLDFSKEEVETVLDVAFDLKRKRALGESHAYLRDKVLAMLFFFSSTRTRGSFEAGMAQLGGHGAFIESKTTQIAHGDTPKEIGEIFGRYFDGIAIRHVDWGIGNGYLNAVAKASRVPVLNMQCDIYHPFQCLADLMTIIEKKGRDLRRKKMVVSWAYAASYQKPMSVPQSLVLQMPRFGLDVVLARINHRGGNRNAMDGTTEEVSAVLKKARQNGKVVIGMKIFGSGQFRAEADREKSLRFAMSMAEIDAVIIGFSSIDEMDQGIKLINRVLAEPAA